MTDNVRKALEVWITIPVRLRPAVLAQLQKEHPANKLKEKP